MRIAVSLSGYFGTLSENNFKSAYKGHQHIIDSLGNLDYIDFYCHCWQPEMQEEIESLYNPVKVVCEPQKDFTKEMVENNISQEYIDEGFDRNNTIYKNARYDRILSFYYSRSTSLKLIEDSDYDWVLATRYDISCRGGKEVNQIKFGRELDNTKIVAPYWNQMNCGYGDMWFYSGFENMKKYSNLYEQALEDFSINSEYERLACEGWPDSKQYNIFDLSDPAQFTNEMLKEDKSDNRMKYPKWALSNSHLHHKFFFMKNKLYENTLWAK